MISIITGDLISVMEMQYDFSEEGIDYLKINSLLCKI
jgi:hypothetical protein